MNYTISITKTCYNPSNNALKYQLGTPKTKKSRSKIIVSEDVIDALKEHKKVQDEVIERLGGTYYNQEATAIRISHSDKNVRGRIERLLIVAKKEDPQKFSELLRSLR